MVDHANPTSTGSDSSGDPLDPVIKEALERFERCEKWESNARRLQMEDYKFANADADNGYQWPNELRKNRDLDGRPCLTINKTRQHNLQIINDAKQNKPGISIRPTGGGATYESAQILESIVRHIEYQSNASVAYDTATQFQVTMGVGYLRVCTDYIDDKTFDQEIYIKRVTDPFCIFIDPDAKEADRSDARYGFVFEDLPKKEFNKLYPKYRTKGSNSPLGMTTGWFTEETVRRAEYWRKVEKHDKLIAYTDPQGQQQEVLASQVPTEIRKELLAHPDSKSRDTVSCTIEWYLILAEEVVEKKIWPGKFIPLVPVIGEETMIEGVMDRKGHTRAMKDPQRMYNYWTSSATEFVALQGKSPWIASAEAIEGYETYWNTANRVNHSVLTYNAFMDDGVTAVPPPQRPAPPTMAPAYIQGMQVAGQELMEVSGQYQPAMGEPSNERSGKAIQERQRQGENSTYHFIDNLAVAIRGVGKILLDLIPKIYDTKRIILIIAEDGTDFDLMIDPQAQKAFQEKQLYTDKVAVQRIFNPQVGMYDVQADIGPGYATKREEAFNALTQIMTQAPALTAILGDILFKSADFPQANEAASRLRRMVPPQALGEGPSQQEQELQMQNQQLQQLLSKMSDELAAEKLRNKGHQEKREVDAYEAETNRWKVFLDHIMQKQEFRMAIAQLVQETQQTNLEAAANVQDGTGDDKAAPKPIAPLHPEAANQINAAIGGQ